MEWKEWKKKKLRTTQSVKYDVIWKGIIQVESIYDRFKIICGSADANVIIVQLNKATMKMDGESDRFNWIEERNERIISCEKNEKKKIVSIQFVSKSS